ncbi:hypothetical protein C8J56DRAFT_1041531 [Mycena floridula]|nr:hypothetical protein C8J56DRAFT_1041531 [Mycena floridula]
MAPIETTLSKLSVRKPRSSGGKKKKLTAFNKFMKVELGRLKTDEPDITHQERFKMAAVNWKTSPSNRLRDASSSP